jgi:hypothetical protein
LQSNSPARIQACHSFALLFATLPIRELYSTKAGRVSYESDVLRQGIFTYYLAKGLAGEAAGCAIIFTSLGVALIDFILVT